MNALNDFVPAWYPLPYNPITMGDFVPGGFPLPQNPVYFVPSAGGSLPKAPDLPMAAIGAKNGKAAIAAASSGCGNCGCGGSCSGCGMGDLAVPSWASSLPTFLQGSVTLPAVGSVPTVYLVGGVLVLAVLVMGGSRGGRRRR
jgi:hypothetical protein